MDIYGHHAAVCPVSGDRIKQHNALRDCLYDFCSNAAWAPVKEKPFLAPFSSERPADIFIPNFTAGKGLVVDFACTCPIQQKYVRSSFQTLTFACNKYAQEVKYDCFLSRIISEGHLYLLVWTAEQYSVRSTPGHSFTYGIEIFSHHGVDFSNQY